MITKKFVKKKISNGGERGVGWGGYYPLCKQLSNNPIYLRHCKRRYFIVRALIFQQFGLGLIGACILASDCFVIE